MKLTLSNSDTPDHMPDPLSNHVSNRRVRNAAIVAAGALAFWAMASLIPYFSGLNITRLTPFFVGAAGYFLGVRAGTGASLAALVIHTLVFNSHGYEGPFAVAQVKPAAHIGIVLIGPLTGRLRAITRRLQSETVGREAAESALRESESRLHQIVNTIREAFWVRNADQNTTVYVSPAFESVFGIRPDKIEKDPRAILEIVHPEDRERLEEKIISAPENDCQLQYRVKRPDGTDRWIETRTFIVRDEEGRTHRIADVSMDVTDRKNAEYALRDSEKRYRTLLDDTERKQLEEHAVQAQKMKAISRRQTIRPKALDPDTIANDMETVLRQEICEDAELDTTTEADRSVIENRAPAAAKRETFLGSFRGSETVLVAEDEPAVQRHIRDALHNKGYRVLSAGDGEAALEVAAAESGTIDLLITDVVMPRMNGRELANELRSRNPLLKVLYVSGHIGKSTVKIAELGSGTSFLSKPFSSEALARKTRLLLDSPPHDQTGQKPLPREFRHHPS